MNARLAAWLQGRDPRLVVGVAAALMIFLTLEAWLLVLRAPLADWRGLVERRQALESAALPAALAAELERNAQAIESARFRLREAAPRTPDEEIVLNLIGSFDRLAAQHGVALGTVKALGHRIEPAYEVASFEVEGHGAYLALVRWLSETEPRVAPLRLAELNLQADGDNRQVTMKVKFAAFLPLAISESRP